MDEAKFISDRAKAVDASGIRKVFDLGASLTDPINLSIGQPDYDVPEAAKAAAIAAIRDGINGYTVTQGIPELRERIHAELKAAYGWEPSVFVTSGVSGGLLLSMMACLNPGDEVLFLDPYFVMYKHLSRLVGVRPVMVDSYPDFRFYGDRVRAAVTDRTKMLILNSPANPTGVLLGAEELAEAAAIATEHDLLILSDEIYEPLVYDGACPSIVSHAKDRTVLLRGFSKGYAMTGWRMGYAAGPAMIINEMIKLQQYTFVCAPSMVQRGGLAAMDVDISDHVDDYREKRDITLEALKDDFEVVRPSGGFYFFVKAPERYASATAFVEEAIRNNVLIIPGNVFSERDTHFRISYATSNDKIREGCAILCKLARGAG
jgi:aspartate aminotransferase/aminotransferase